MKGCCCAQARAYCFDPKVVVTIWRYLNLAHCAGYCGLSPTYNKHNLFGPFTVRHPLLRKCSGSERTAGPRASRKSVLAPAPVQLLAFCPAQPVLSSVPTPVCRGRSR